MRGRRSKMSRSSSRKNFSRGARRVHRKNHMSPTVAGPMRGGIRL